jgi:hypothetical protein
MDNANEIVWIKGEGFSPEEYITLYISNKQIYINNEIMKQIGFDFNYIKVGIDKKKKKVYIKPISIGEEEDYSLVDLNKFSLKTKKFLNSNLVKQMLDLIEPDIVKKSNSIRIKTEIKTINDLGLMIVGDLTCVYPN